MSSAIARKIGSIEQRGGMRPVDIANILGTRPETVSRWNQGKNFPRHEAEKILLDLEYIVDLLSDFYEPQEARLWLFTRQKRLKGKRPVDLVREGEADTVITMLDLLRDGVFL